MNYYVYIIKWDNKHYIWYTNDIKRRFEQHVNWKTKTTKSMWNLELLWYFEKETKTSAIILERKIKKNWHIEQRINHPTFIHGGCSSVG